MYSVNDINRIFASFSNYQFTVNHYQNQNNGGVYIEGDSQIFSPATLNWSSSATVTSAKYTDKEMDICFTLETLYSEKYEETTNTLQYNVSETIDKKAILEPDEMGKYRIVRIENHDSSAKDTKENQLSEVSELYENILNSVANGEAEYGFPEVVDNRSECQYFLYDMDGDDIPELIVGKESIVDTVIITKICHVYSCKKTDSGYTVTRISENMLSPQIPSEGSGVCVAYYNRGQALYSVYRVTIQGQVLTETKEREFHMGEAAEQEYFQKNLEPAWTDISDHNPLTSTMVRK